MAKKYIAFKEDTDKIVGLSSGLEVTYGVINYNNGHSEVTIPHMVNLLLIWSQITKVTPVGTAYRGAPYPTLVVLTATPTKNICTSSKICSDYIASTFFTWDVSLSTNSTSATITAEVGRDDNPLYYAAIKLY